MDTPESNNQKDDQIAHLVNEYFDRRQSGEELSPAQFAEEHPGLAQDLKPYLDGLALLDEIRSATAEMGVPALSSPSPRELPAIDGYELLEETGRGGMGVVYKAKQIYTNRIVAVKVMLAGPFASARSQRRFEREVQLAARLRHPRIVTVLESGQVSSGQKYFAMDYVAGLHLDKFIRKRTPDPQAILALFIDICEAVHYAHDSGVIHRDLKPANVLVDENGIPHVMDFGLAKAMDAEDMDDSITAEFSAPGQVMGTLRYLSPEQATGAQEEVDLRTDVYALGLMLYESLTGSMPYDISGKPSDIIKRIVESQPVKPSAISDTVDTELGTILLKALEKEQALRYASAAEMGEDLRRYLAGEPIQAKRTSRVYLLNKAVRRYRTEIVVLGVAMVLAVGGTMGGTWWAHHQLQQAQLQTQTKGRLELAALQFRLEQGESGGVAVNMVLGKYPKLEESRLVFARGRFEGDEVNGTIQFLEAELSTKPSRWPCKELLAEVYRNLEPEDEAEGQVFAGEIIRLQAAVDRQAPDTSEAWYYRTFTTLDPEIALKRAHNAVQLDEENELAWIRIRDLATLLGHEEEAMNAASRLSLPVEAAE